ncbi:acyl carrier protein [Streptomyces sp. AV19]|nr:acyl carrier protein [Streptomyces sp. AV19]MDG4533894.1 acyl carrier protein [Streptomyces sp. AV19]
MVAFVARITHRAPERIDRTQALDTLGPDSPMVTELVVALRSELGCEIPTVEVINADSIDDLAGRVLSLLGVR